MDINMFIFTCSTCYGSDHNELLLSETMLTTKKFINLDQNYMYASGVYTLKNI